MTTLSKITATPGDKQITVTIDKVYRSGTGISGEDFDKPFIKVVAAAGTPPVATRRVPIIPLIESVPPGGKGTLNDGRTVIIPDLINGRGYTCTYYQKGEQQDPSGARDSYQIVYPHPAPNAPILNAELFGTPSGDFYVNYRLGINLNDIEHTANTPVGTDTIEKLNIYYMRVHDPPDYIVSATDADIAEVIITLEGSGNLHSIRTNGYYPFGPTVLKKDAKYSFYALTISDGVNSPDSNTITAVMKKVAIDVSSLILTHSTSDINTLNYVLTVDPSGKTQGDDYKLYKEVLKSDGSWTSTPIRDVSDGDISLNSFTSFITGELGEVIRMVAVPYSSAGIKGREKVSDAIMVEGLKNHMLEIDLSGISVLNGMGYATVTFTASHNSDELSYAYRYINIKDLSNDKFDIFEDDNSTPLSLTEKLTLNDDGKTSKRIYLKLKVGTDNAVSNRFSLPASGYKAVYPPIISAAVNPNEDVSLLTSTVFSRPFTFSVTPSAPPRPTLNPLFLKDAIKVEWSTANVTDANKPTSYTVRLSSTTDSTFPAQNVNIENGNEYHEFLGLSRANASGSVIIYTVSVTSKNAVGSSQTDASASELPILGFPATYLQNFSVAEKQPVVVSSTGVRKYVGTIKINDSLWGGAFNKLTLTNNTEFGATDASFSAVEVDISGGKLVKQAAPLVNTYTFEFDLSGGTTYNLEAKASTSARVAGEGGATALGAATSPSVYATVLKKALPVVKRANFTLNKTNKTTSYEIRVDPQGLPITSMQVIAIPDIAGNNNPASVEISAKKEMVYSNLEELWKIKFDFLVKTYEVSGTTYGADVILVNNVNGVTKFGDLYLPGNTQATDAFLGAMNHTVPL